MLNLLTFYIGEEMTKYRFKIIYSETTKENVSLVANLEESGWDGSICTKNDDGTFAFRSDDDLVVHRDLGKLPHSFLTEIKEPLTLEESWLHFSEIFKHDNPTPKHYYSNGWNDAHRKQELCQVVDEEKDIAVLKEFMNSSGFQTEYSIEYRLVLAIWLAALKYARGIE